MSLEQLEECVALLKKDGQNAKKQVLMILEEEIERVKRYYNLTGRRSNKK